MLLPIMEFPKNKVTSLNCFLDQEILSSVHEKGDEKAFLPKVAEAYGKIIFPRGKKYPYTFGSIALSMDGKMAYPDNLDGDMLVHSNTYNENGALTDFWILNFLRAYSDAVLIGTKSMKTEANEWITIYDEDLIKERVENMKEKEAQPFTIVSSKDGTDIMYEHLLFHQHDIPVLVFTSPAGFENIIKNAPDNFYLLEDVTKENIYKLNGKHPVVVTGNDSDTDISRFLELMKSAGVDHILIESPMIMWHLLKEKLLNEYFITYSTVFIGGQYTPGNFSPFTFENHPQSKIAYLNHHENTFLFTRQIVEDEK